MSKNNRQRKISSVFAVDRQTGNATFRMSPQMAIMLISKGKAALTSPDDPNCTTVYLLAEKPAERQAVSAMFGAVSDPLRDLRAHHMIGSLEDYVIESSDVDADYGKPVLPTIGYDRTSPGYSTVRNFAPKQLSSFMQAESVAD